VSDQIQELLDKEAIRSVLYRLCRAVDRRDKELMVSCYHPDATEDHGAFLGDAADFCALASQSEGGFYLRMHHNIGTINIELKADLAESEAYFCASGPLATPAEDGSTQVRGIYGRYIDRFERRNGEWRIAQRIVVKDWTDIRTVCDPLEQYPLSEYGPTDIAYTRLSPRLGV